MVIIFYQDNLIIITSLQERISHTQKMLQREFELTDFMLMHFYLGIKFWQDPEIIFIFQSKYVGEILQEFRMTKCKSLGTPMEVDLKLSMEDTSPLVEESLYQKLVGSLNFLCNMRCVLSRFSQVPTESLQYWDANFIVF